MAVVLGRDLGLAICKALNIDAAKVYGISLHCAADGVAALTVERRLYDYERRELVSLFSKMEAVDISLEQKVTRMCDEARARVHARIDRGAVCLHSERLR